MLSAQPNCASSWCMASVQCMLQVIIDLGRRPEARFLGVSGGEYLRDGEVSGFLERFSVCVRQQSALTDSCAAARYPGMT